MDTIQTYSVIGMSCGHCESAIRGEVSQIPGVEKVEVSAATGRLAVTAAEPIASTAVISAVAEAGYQAEQT